MKDRLSLSFLTGLTNPNDQVEQKIVKRIARWTDKLIEHREKTKNLIPHEQVLEEDKGRFGNLTGQYLTALRKERGMTQPQLAEKSGLSQSTISKIETGEKPMSYTDAAKLAAVLKVSEKFLITGRE